MTWGPTLIERRRGRRFHVDWPVRVESVADGGATFTETGVVGNISSSGALLLIDRPLAMGAKLDIYISLPLKGNKLMKYSASVVRVESEARLFAAAIKFDAPKPEFTSI
ncbi:MAG: PilZ domain-containing protein [Acidobacteriota bacterium]